MIDLNRGVSKRTVKTKNGDLQVCMYKDQPGVYLDEQGNEYPPESALRFAKKAGFDVEEMEKLRVRNEKMAEAQARIDDELDLPKQEKQPPAKNRGGRPPKAAKKAEEPAPEDTPAEGGSEEPAEAEGDEPEGKKSFLSKLTGAN